MLDFYNRMWGDINMVYVFDMVTNHFLEYFLFTYKKAEELLKTCKVNTAKEAVTRAKNMYSIKSASEISNFWDLFKEAMYEDIAQRQKLFGNQELLWETVFSLSTNNYPGAIFPPPIGMEYLLFTRNLLTENDRDKFIKSFYNGNVFWPDTNILTLDPATYIEAEISDALVERINAIFAKIKEDLATVDLVSPNWLLFLAAVFDDVEYMPEGIRNQAIQCGAAIIRKDPAIIGSVFTRRPDKYYRFMPTVLAQLEMEEIVSLIPANNWIDELFLSFYEYDGNNYALRDRYIDIITEKVIQFASPRDVAIKYMLWIKEFSSSPLFYFLKALSEGKIQWDWFDEFLTHIANKKATQKQYKSILKGVERFINQYIKNVDDKFEIEQPPKFSGRIKKHEWQKFIDEWLRDIALQIYPQNSSALHL